MRESDFSQDAPGMLVRASGPEGQYWAFVPDPLPPALVLDQATIKRLSDADRSLGELKGIGRMLPNPHLLIGPFMRREAVASSRIEGTITDLRQLLLFEADPSEGSALDEDDGADRQEVLNYVGALTLGFERLKSLPISRRLIREVHERLMRGVRGEEKRPGEFRDRQNMIGLQGQTPEQARFVPPPLPQMNQALDELELFIARPSDLPVLIDLALIHYQFETIHPFLDGNGRLGRLLISLLLCDRDVLTQPLLYLSAYFEENKADYMDHLLKVSQAGEWLGWVNFFLEGVAVQSKKAISRCNQLLDLWNEYRARLQKVSQSSNLLQLVDMLFDRPAVSVPQVREQIGITNTAAQQNVERLVAEGILTEVTGRKRNRIYLAARILEIIESP
jgi:Fic family protein